MEIHSLQVEFTKSLIKLLTMAFNHGYEITLGEAYRTAEQAAWNAANGKGIKNSLHCKRLAIDLNLFKDGKFLTASEDYKPLGVFWESLSTQGVEHCWGGRFSDGNHFSIAFGGAK